MTYQYDTLKDLKPGSKANFYGKIVFMTRKEQNILLLLKDETGCIYVLIDQHTKETELKFELRQVVRFHRCEIRATLKSKEGIAKIGAAGCHLVVWAPFGDVNNPTVKSSRTWTKSESDEKRIKSLSELGKNAKKTSVEELAEKLIFHREKERTEKEIAAFWNKSEIESKQCQPSASSELFNSPVRSVVELDNEFLVDSSYWSSVTGEMFQFFADCRDCFHSCETPYADDEFTEKCNMCGMPANKVILAVRVKVVSRDFQLLLTLPITLFLKYRCMESLHSYCAESFSSSDRDQITEKLRIPLKVEDKLIKLTSIKLLRSVDDSGTDESLTEGGPESLSSPSLPEAVGGRGGGGGGGGTVEVVVVDGRGGGGGGVGALLEIGGNGGADLTDGDGGGGADFVDGSFAAALGSRLKFEDVGGFRVGGLVGGGGGAVRIGEGVESFISANSST